MSAAALLALQRRVGNRAAASVVVSRQVPPVAPPVAAPPVGAGPAAGFRPVADFDTMTLGEFHDYARGKPDWSTDPALIPARRQSLFTTLEFARAGDPAPVGPCGDIPLHDIEATGLPAATRDTLRAYSRGKVAKDTAGLPATSVLADALRDGEALGKLEAAIPKGVLHRIMGTTAEGKAQFPALVGAAQIDAFAAYAKRSGAFLEAENGADVASYLDMVNVDGADPASFIGRLPRVRNYHRFLAPMLEHLVTNEGDTSRAKPLLLILHTGSDHNGAFHRDAQLQALVEHPRNLTIMVEGATTLEAVGGEAGAIARRQGQGRKIEQLMIAGHGSPRSMDLAGRPDASGAVSSRQSLDLDRNRARTEKFLRGLMGHMATGPDARIVLNACLTAADEVSQNLSSDPATARNQIRRSLRNSPSLAARLQQLAPGRIVEGNVSSVPAGEYMSRDPGTGAQTGVLHQIIPSDPHATGSDRATYVEHGEEPEGCMRAVVALWALDRTECLNRVNARRAKPLAGTWSDRVIRTFYDIVNAQPDNASLMNRIANSVARGLSEFDLTAEQRPGTIAGLNNDLSPAEASSILTPLYPHAPATARLAIEQVWMIRTPGRRPTFLALLDTFATTVDATPHLDVDWLAPSLSTLLPVASAGAPTRAQMKLALFARDDASAQAFLRANAGAARRLTMPAGTTVPGLTGGDLTEDDVLRDLGLLGAAPGPSGGGPAPNMDLDGDGVPDIYVESLTRQAMVTARRLNVRPRPELTAAPFTSVAAGARVDVIGEVGKWFAVDHAGRVGFVWRTWVRRLPVR